MNLWFDVKYAGRLLKKSWGYSLLCASVVALSVGLAVFTSSLVYSQLFKPLGFPDSERWYSVQIAARAAGTPRPVVDAYTYQQLLAQNRAADFLGAYTNRPVLLSEGQATTSVRAAAVTPRLLRATRVPPLIGRVFEDTDAQPGAAAVAILSFDAWHTYFAGDPAVVGKTARIDAAPVQIVGVMPAGFILIRDFELWQPLQMPRLAGAHDSTMELTPFIAVSEGQNVEALINEMKPAVDAVNRDYPDLFDATRRVALIPGHRTFTHSETPIAVMIVFMAAGVLALGCVNISMVFLTRLRERSRELALRTALGAWRTSLLRQCLLETVLIVLPGLVVGYGLASLVVGWAESIADFAAQTNANGRFPNLLELRPIDLALAVAAATAMWLLSTLVPALRVVKQDAAALLAGSGKGSSIRTSNTSVGLLVGLQVLISSVVLAVCGNVVLSVDKEVAKPTGMNTAQVMLATFPTAFNARFAQAPERLRYWEDLRVAIESEVAGAEVAFTTAVPTNPTPVGAAIETQEGNDTRGSLTLPFAVVSDNYFTLLGLNLRSGRLF